MKQIDDKREERASSVGSQCRFSVGVVEVMLKSRVRVRVIERETEE